MSFINDKKLMGSKKQQRIQELALRPEERAIKHALLGAQSMQSVTKGSVTFVSRHASSQQARLPHIRGESDDYTTSFSTT
jgi:D-tyrosyl-tRNA(Tyr) deacylase